MARIRGTGRADTLRGTSQDDDIFGFDGNDQIFGGAGNDVIRPGNGKDVAHGGAGNDRFLVTEYDERAPDQLFGDGGRDTLDLSGVPLADFVTFEWDYDARTDSYTVENFFGDGIILRFSGMETIVGSRDDDSMRFDQSMAGLTIDAGTGDDFVSGGSGNDMIVGGIGDDSLYGGGGKNVLLGGAGDDTLSLDGDSLGRMDGGAGIDTGFFSGSVDLERGVGHNSLGERIFVKGVENLQLFFNVTDGVASGDDRANTISAIYTNAAVTLNGRGGDDILTGTSQADHLNGGNGDDTITGGSGSDVLSGGAGADRFDMAIASGVANPLPVRDTIVDFSQGDGDRIDLTFVDAIPSTPSNDSFSFIGTAAFGNVAGELRYQVRHGATLVQADFDGDGASDYEIKLKGAIELKAGDFIKVADQSMSAIHEDVGWHPRLFASASVHDQALGVLA